MSSRGCCGIDVSVSMQLQVLDLVDLSKIFQDILQIVLQKQCILVENHEFCYLMQSIYHLVQSCVMMIMVVANSVGERYM